LYFEFFQIQKESYLQDLAWIVLINQVTGRERTSEHGASLWPVWSREATPPLGGTRFPPFSERKNVTHPKKQCPLFYRLIDRIQSKLAKSPVIFHMRLAKEQVAVVRIYMEDKIAVNPFLRSLNGFMLRL
jgi:hypothetical protein